MMVFIDGGGCRPAPPRSAKTEFFCKIWQHEDIVAQFVRVIGQNLQYYSNDKT
jgi:hypothetical protein